MHQAFAMDPSARETQLPYRPSLLTAALSRSDPLNATNEEDVAQPPETSPTLPPGTAPSEPQSPSPAHAISEDWWRGNYDYPSQGPLQRYLSSQEIREDDRSNLMGNLRLPLLAFVDAAADTLVFIDPAPRHPQPTSSLPFTMNDTGTVPHRIHSNSLLRTGSKVFEKMFEVRQQYRVRKRRGMTEKLPDGVKYVLDLTPEAEGDDALVYMTEVSCPMGIRTWGDQAEKLNLPRFCVGGEDEREWHSAPPPDLSLKVVQDESTKPAEPTASTDVKPESAQPVAQPKRRAPRPRMNWEGIKPRPPPETDAFEEPTYTPEMNTHVATVRKIPGLPMDYSPVRHRTCIERVLHALEGLDPRLDTAPKLWTFVAVAKLFEVGSDALICDYVLSWLFHTSNALFIEMHPEITYRIAHGIRHSDLCRIAFSILVGEEAGLLLRNSRGKPRLVRETKTIYGRARETLDDTELQRIEYASKVFMDRMLQSFVDMVGVDMSWVDPIAHRYVVGKVTPFNLPIIHELTQRLKEHIRAFVVGVLHERLPNRPGDDNDGSFTFSNTRGIPTTDFSTAYNLMSLAERILSRTFWSRLRGRNIQDHLDSGYCGPVLVDWKLSNVAAHLNVFATQENARIVYRSRESLQQQINMFSETMAEMDPSLTQPYWYRDSIGSVPHVNERGVVDTIGNKFQYVVPPQFLLYEFLDEVQTHIRNVCNNMTRTLGPEVSNYGIWFDNTDVLLCLDEHEYQFLPLWASGNDDGTGGVFSDQDMPILETGGFSMPGPGIHTGSSAAPSGVDIPDDAVSIGSFSTINPSDAASTMQRISHVADSGRTTTIGDSAASDQLWQEIRDFDLHSASGSTAHGGDTDNGTEVEFLKEEITIADDGDLDVDVDVEDAEDIEFEFSDRDGDDDDDVATIGAGSGSDIGMDVMDEDDDADDEDNDKNEFYDVHDDNKDGIGKDKAGADRGNHADNAIDDEYDLI